VVPHIPLLNLPKHLQTFSLIGLGSNQGDTINNLRCAVAALRDLYLTRVIALSPFYESDALLLPNAPTDWQLPFLNGVALIKTGLEPLSLLHELKKIEQNFKRVNLGRYSPRTIDLDILFYGDEELNTLELKIPHREIVNRSFVYLPIKILAEHFRLRGEETALYFYSLLNNFNHLAKNGVRISLNALFKNGLSESVKSEGLNTKLSSKSYSQLVGILNATPDSFSNDGILGLSEEEFAKKIDSLINQADIIDLGAESTRPNGKAITAAEELYRLKRTLAKFPPNYFNRTVNWSLDSRNIETIRHLLKFNPKIINDVSGAVGIEHFSCFLENPALKYCFMHSLSVPVKLGEIISEDQDTLDQLINWGENKISDLLSLGFKREQLIFDPGTGFAKSGEQSWEILRRVRELRALNLPIFLGHSRKSYLNKVSSSSDVALTTLEKDLLTSIVSFQLFSAGVEFLRVHNLDFARFTLQSWQKASGVVEF
jgi:2-amino-4-hydroxy-6-hydroxymethyldihydropteridine diphosphokinase / dihydropteroate synthase